MARDSAPCDRSQPCRKQEVSLRSPASLNTARHELAGMQSQLGYTLRAAIGWPDQVPWVWNYNLDVCSYNHLGLTASTLLARIHPIAALS